MSDTPAIEPNLVVFFHDRAALPPEYAESLATTRAHNPDLTTIFLDDDAARALLAEHYPQLAALYDRVTVPAARSDIARLAALHRYGGFYTDIGMAWTARLRDLTEPGDALLLVRRDDIDAFRGREETAHVINGVLGAKAGSPFLLDCLKRIHFLLSEGLFNHIVFIATGPQILTEIYFRDRHRPGFAPRVASFREILGGRCRMVRAKGVANAWVAQQREGIVSGGLPGPADTAEARAWEAATPAKGPDRGQG